VNNHVLLRAFFDRSSGEFSREAGQLRVIEKRSGGSQVDAYSEIVSRVKLNSALYFNAEFSAPWGVGIRNGEELAPILCPGAQHILNYHYVLEGRAFAKLHGGPAMVLQRGDVVVFPRGSAHLLTSDPDSNSTLETDAALAKIKSGEMTLLQVGGGGAKTRFVCGFVACDPHLSKPVFEGLPDMFKVNISTDRGGRWLEASILHLVEEAASNKQGSQAMLAKVSEALVVETLRRYLATLPVAGKGWLAGARDPIVGKTLALMHTRVAESWTTVELARQVGISRTVLMERFTRLLAEPPIAYLTRWRLSLAAQSLAGTSHGMSEIASEIGYESEAAFSRAFKREFGMPPARYRKEQRQSGPVQHRARDIDAQG
jgi:AraC-like DNA-binding protein